MWMGDILRLTGQMVGMKTGAAIVMTLGPGNPRLIQTIQDGAPATSITWASFRGLLYLVVVSLYFVSLVLKCTRRREGPSHLTLGAACICAMICILFELYGQLQLGYILAGVALIDLVLVAMFYACLPDRADQRMGT